MVDKDKDEDQEKDHDQDHAAKRRRIAHAQLHKPFKSPLARSVLREHPHNTLSATPAHADPETAELLQRKQRLEQQCKVTRARIDVMKQATRLRDGKEDEELEALARKWRAAARQAAEHLHGAAVDRIHRMGGEEVWRENLRQKHLDTQAFQRRLHEEDAEEEENTEEGRERRRMRDAATPPPVEALPEPDIPPSYSMKVTLMQLHVDFNTIGFDESTDAWKT